MKLWCRLCRKWVYEQHFETKDSFRGGCGQGRKDIRYHPENPLCGDIWKLKDGRHFVVDYKDSFCTGVTFSDGQQGGMKYTAGFRNFLEHQEAELISTFEEFPFRHCDYRGWTRKEDQCTLKNSLAFLNRVLDLRKQNEISR